MFHYYDAVASNLFGASMPEWPFNCYDQMTPLSDKSNIMLQTLGPAATAKIKKNLCKYQKSKIFGKSHLVYFDLDCFMLTICTKSSGTQKENQNKMDYTKSYNWEAESDEKL